MRIDKDARLGDAIEGDVVITLTNREAEQLRLELASLHRGARVRGHLTAHADEVLAELGIEPAPYPGHVDTWPTWKDGKPPATGALERLRNHPDVKAVHPTGRAHGMDGTE